MFFLEKQLLHNRDIVLPHSFFELVMPLLSSEPYAVGIYLYAYYMSTNTYDDAEPIHDHKKLADKLGVTLDDVYNTWKICEDYGLIKKHILDEEVAGSYSIEFRDLRTIVGSTKSKGLSTDELIVAYQNEEYKKMYDRIEQTIKYPLSANDIRKIHQMITDFNISKDLVVEAVLYSIYKKNSRSISLALGVLRNWHLDGIRTVEDLEQMMQGKEKRYLEYKKILRAMGEYRSATKPEKEMMDMWLDEYGFDLDSVLDAVGKTISIKSPNLKYVDGVLKNQLEAIRKMDQEAPQPILPSKEGESPFELRTKILELIQFPRKSLRRDEKDDLDELARDYNYSDIEIAYRHLKKKQQEITLANLLRLFKGEETQQERVRKITLDQVKRAEAQRRYIKKSEAVKNNTDESRKLGPMEKRLYEKQLARMKNREQE